MTKYWWVNILLFQSHRWVKVNGFDYGYFPLSLRTENMIFTCRIVSFSEHRIRNCLALASKWLDLRLWKQKQKLQNWFSLFIQGAGGVFSIKRGRKSRGTVPLSMLVKTCIVLQERALAPARIQSLMERTQSSHPAEGIQSYRRWTFLGIRAHLGDQSPF